MSSHNEKLLELAMQHAVNGQGDLAAPLVATCLAPGAGLTETEISLAYDIVRILIGSVDTGIRRQLAEYLADRDDLPPDLATSLIDDDISVAYPVLVHNKTLQDDTLIGVIARRTKPHRMAITIRQKISKAVSLALVKTEDRDAIESLLYNKTAEIGAHTLETLIFDYRGDGTLQVPLAHRRELSDEQALRLAGQVSQSLRKHLLAHFDIEAEAN